MQRDQALSENGSINYNEALHRMDGDESFLLELLGDYMTEFAEYFKSMVSAAMKNDMEELSVLGHTLKGSSAMLSLNRMNVLSAALERSGKENDLEEAKRLIKLMNAEFMVLSGLFSNELKKPN